MKLINIFLRAAKLCGISENYLDNNDISDLQSRALTAINTTLFDLCGEPEHRLLSETADVSETCIDAAIYGTAMYLSLAFGDTDNASLFSKIYNSKRAAVKSSLSRIADVLPKTEANI